MSLPTTKPTTFPHFSHLPTSLRQKIWSLSLPTHISLTITDTLDLDITSVPAPSGAALACKEPRATYLAEGFKPYFIYAAEDWLDVHVNQESVLELVIPPSETSNANLNVTWTELGFQLHDILRIVKRVKFACEKPERLTRLWVGSEEGLIRPGGTHWDEILFTTESIKGDRDAKESLREGFRVEVCVREGDEEEWELKEERVVKGYGLERRFYTIRVFKRVGEEVDREVEEWEGFVKGNEGVEKKRDALTKEAIKQFVRETGWKPRSSVTSSIYSGDMVYDGEVWLTVA